MSGTLLSNQHAVVIAGSFNLTAIYRELQTLGAEPQKALRESRLLLIDAQDMLDRFMSAGYPDARRFDASVGNLVRSIARRGSQLRAYGEMVGVLWSRGEDAAALRLEHLWNKLRKEVPFSLFCGYPIDVFGDHFESGSVDGLLSAHTHLLSAGPGESVHAAVARAVQEVVGDNVLSPPSTGQDQATATLPKGERLILWVRKNLPEKAPEILALARTYQQELSAAS